MSELQYIDIEFCIWHIYNIFSTFSEIVFLFFLRTMHTFLVISSSHLQKEIKSQRNFAKSQEIYKLCINLYSYQFVTTYFVSYFEDHKKINLFIIFLTLTWKIQIEKNSKFNSNLYFIKKKELQIPIVMILKRKRIEIRWIPKFHRFKHSRKVAWTSEYINAILTNLVYSIQSVIACRSRAVGTHFA